MTIFELAQLLAYYTLILATFLWLGGGLSLFVALACLLHARLLALRSPT